MLLIIITILLLLTIIKFASPFVCDPGYYYSVNRPLLIMLSPSTSPSPNCYKCIAGKYSTGNSDKCIKCEIGKFSSSGAGNCTDCPIGKTTIINGSTTCINCPGKSIYY